MTSTPILPQAPRLGLLAYSNGMTTTAQTVFTANTTNLSLGSKMVSLYAVSSDVTARIFRVSIARGGTSYYQGAVSVAASSGYDGTNNQIDFLSNTAMPGLPKDSDGRQYILMANGDTLQVSSTTTLTNTTVFVYLTAIGADY